MLRHLCVLALLFKMAVASLYAENIPILEYYESGQTKVRPVAGKYLENQVETISTNLSALIPLYRKPTQGLLLNAAYNSLIRDELDPEIPRQFTYLSVMKLGFLSYFELSKTFSPIIAFNYFNHPTTGIRPMFDSYLGGRLWGKYTLLLRVIYRTHKNNFGNSVTPFFGWLTKLAETWDLDVLLPAHLTLIYKPFGNTFLWTNGIKAEARDFPHVIEGSSGWLTGYHVKFFSQLAYGVYKDIYLALGGGGIMTSNEFYPYEATQPSYAFREDLSPFLSFAVEAHW